MNVINIKTSENIAKAIKKQYFFNKKWFSTSKNSAEDIEYIFNKLKLTPDIIKDEELADILGEFKHWRYNMCHVCSLNKLENMIHISDDYEGNEIIICEKCLNIALEKLTKKRTER